MIWGIVFKMTKVVALGGKYKTVSSFLSQAMADPTITNVVMITFHDNGESEFAQFECSRMQLSFASIVIAREAMGE